MSGTSENTLPAPECASCKDGTGLQPVRHLPVEVAGEAGPENSTGSRPSNHA